MNPRNTRQGTYTLRMLNDPATRRRLGYDPRMTDAENAGTESLFDRPDEALEWPEVKRNHPPSWERSPALPPPEDIVGPDMENLGRHFDEAVARYVTWPVEDHKVTDPYGERLHPKTGKWHLHNGTDFKAPRGAPISSPAKGKVIQITKTERGGDTIFVQYDTGGIGGFAHTAPAEGLRVGQEVWAGDQIGTSNGSGLLSAPHLHYTFRDGSREKPARMQDKPVNPEESQFKGLRR